MVTERTVSDLSRRVRGVRRELTQIRWIATSGLLLAVYIAVFITVNQLIGGGN